MDKLDHFFHDLKIILWSLQSRTQVEFAARNRLECLIDDICSNESASSEYLLTKCQQRLKMVEHIAGAAPVVRLLDADVSRAIEDIKRKRTA
jgi:hypothetical protein